MLDRVFHNGKMWNVVTRFYGTKFAGRIKIECIDNKEQVEDLLLFDGEVKVLNSWIGLNDKDGKPIYGGDVIKWKFGSVDTYDVVAWNVDRTGYTPFIGTQSFDGLIYPNSNQVEVVGNIYENPGLLKLVKS